MTADFTIRIDRRHVPECRGISIISMVMLLHRTGEAGAKLISCDH